MTRTQKIEIFVAKMLLCVVLVLGICYVPDAIYFFLDKRDDMAPYNNLFWFGLGMINAAVNFLIYALISRIFQIGLRRKPSSGNVGPYTSSSNTVLSKAASGG